MLIDLAGLSVLSQQSTENPLATHPDNTGRHTSLGSTLSLTRTGVSALSLGGVSFADTEARMHDGGLLDDEAISEELADVLARVGIADFGCLIGIQPDLALAAVEDLGSKLLL